MSSGTARSLGTNLEVRHLRREVKTALELAIVALAPAELLERLGAVAGLLEAVAEFPADSPPALALLPGLAERGERCLREWREWDRAHRDQTPA